jgi:hypothetical protein
MWDIFKLFLELNDKNEVAEYLEVLLNYLVNSPGELTEKEIQEPVNRIIEEGGTITPLTQLTNSNLMYH